MSYRAMLPLLLAAIFLTVAGPALAQLPNITYYYDPGFTYPLTPTGTQLSGPPFILPATLPGNTNTIFLNLAGINNGPVATSVDLYGTCLLDGEGLLGWSIGGPMPAGQVYQWYGAGPLNIRGGRHTLGVAHDDPGAIVESNENDNIWGHQFIFTPYVLSPATPKTRGTPPDRLGGFSSIIDGSPIYANCDGFRFASTGYWNAITMYAADIGDDYDLALFSPSTGSENGFINPISSSTYIEGFLDAVIVNRNTVGIADYDIGVTNFGGNGQFVIEQVISTQTFVGDSMPITLGTDEYLRIWDTWIGDTGWVTVTVDDPTADGEVFKVAWIENNVTEIGFPDITDWEFTDENGRAALHRDFTTTGWYGLVVNRDPRDGGVSKSIQIDIEATTPDLMPFSPYLWHSELVPTPTPVTPGMASTLPEVLHGFLPETYINFGLYNDSPVPSPSVGVAVYLDGIDQYLHSYVIPPLAAYQSIEINDQGAVEFPGGRHTIIVEADFHGDIHEFNEDNNFYGEQYCWSPMELSLGTQVSRPHPGLSHGGYFVVDPAEPFHANCDGYRLYTGVANWEGLVLNQGAESDYDLAIHHPLTGVKNGFDDFLAVSEFVQGETDYVLFNNNLLPPGDYDIGVINFLEYSPYDLEAVGSTNLSNPDARTHGPFQMPMTNMLHLYNIYLEPDLYAFRLDNVTGVVDWGFALHPFETLMQGRQDAMVDGAAWLNGPGAPEWFTVHVPDGGWFCLAVYKATPFDFERDGTYELTILQGVSDVEDQTDLPVATVLTGVHPNPFNPQTTISYELAIAADVELEIYDVKGARVRRLVSESMPAGRHAAVWNGKTDSGARVASGVYLARFSAGAYRDFTKLVMLK
jgi:hypothetical protein